MNVSSLNRLTKRATNAKVAFVRFDGAHGGIFHYVHGYVAIGDKVRVIFKDRLERTGSILDIAYFQEL